MIPRAFRVSFGTYQQRSRRSRFLTWLSVPVIILAIPVVFLIALVILTILLIRFLPAGFRLFRTYRRFKKAIKSPPIEVEYWVSDEEDKP